MDALGFGLAGGIVAALGLLSLVRTLLFVRRAERAEGRIVGRELYSGSGGRGPTYKPVIEFATPDGAVHRFTDPIQSNRPGDVGDTVPVRYDPRRPGRARLDKPFRLWFVPGLLLFIGATFLAAGLGS